MADRQLWRVRPNIVLPVAQELPNGSYLSQIVATLLLTAPRAAYAANAPPPTIDS